MIHNLDKGADRLKPDGKVKFGKYYVLGYFGQRYHSQKKFERVINLYCFLKKPTEHFYARDKYPLRLFNPY